MMTSCTVRVQVTVEAPPTRPEPLHWVTVAVGAVLISVASVVAVHVSVPPALPEPLHWASVLMTGRPVGKLAGVFTQVTVLGGPWGLTHWLIVDVAAAPLTTFVRLLVMVTVQVTVAAPLIPALLHWSTELTGVVCEVVTVPAVFWQAGDPVQLRDTATVVASVKVLLAPKVRLLVTVTVQVTVAAPDVPAPSHWLRLAVCALTGAVVIGWPSPTSSTATMIGIHDVRATPLRQRALVGLRDMRSLPRRLSRLGPRGDGGVTIGCVEERALGTPGLPGSDSDFLPWARAPISLIRVSPAPYSSPAQAS
jgi:hypothetical protein